MRKSGISALVRVKHQFVSYCIGNSEKYAAYNVKQEANWAHFVNVFLQQKRLRLIIRFNTILLLRHLSPILGFPFVQWRCRYESTACRGVRSVRSLFIPTKRRVCFLQLTRLIAVINN